MHLVNLITLYYNYGFINDESSSSDLNIKYKQIIYVIKKNKLNIQQNTTLTPNLLIVRNLTCTKSNWCNERILSDCLSVQNFQVKKKKHSWIMFISKTVNTPDKSSGTGNVNYFVNETKIVLYAPRDQSVTCFIENGSSR
jgi:hypothetical protein